MDSQPNPLHDDDVEYMGCLTIPFHLLKAALSAMQYAAGWLIRGGQG